MLGLDVDSVPLPQKTGKTEIFCQLPFFCMKCTAIVECARRSFRWKGEPSLARSASGVRV